MKRLLTSFFLFLEQFDTPEARVVFDMESYGISWWNEKVWINILTKDVKIPSNFLPLFDMIIDNYGREIWEGSMNEEEEDYYQASISFKVDQRLMIITSIISENGEDPSSDEYDLNNNEVVNTFLDENNLNSIVVEYQGGGDDGYIENKGKDDNGNQYSLSAGMEDVAYSYLETSFGGWENNEGAYGTIKISKETVEIEHIWITREDVDSDLRIVIKLEDVE